MIFCIAGKNEIAIYGAGSTWNQDEVKNDFLPMENLLLAEMKKVQKIYMKLFHNLKSEI